MSERIFTWHYPEPNAPLPAFYADKDYEPGEVRIYAEVAPDVGDCELDIFDDGVSIFGNHAANHIYVNSTNRPYSEAANTKVCLPKGQTVEEHAEDFTGTTIAEDSWLTCRVYNTNGARNITVHLEVTSLDDEATE